MSSDLPKIYLARHGETEWTLTHQHTGLTDIPLTERGERNAQRLEQRLGGHSFAKVLTSPLQRAKRTCERAGYHAVAETEPDLVEVDYGDYEGLRTVEIQREHPDWNLFRDWSPNGDTGESLSARADRILARLRDVRGDVLLFSHGHFLRCLAARWLGLPVDHGRYFLLTTASLSILGYEHNVEEPAVLLWNDDRHVGE